MLQSLYIRDFVIVEHLELELGSGFTVLTGETGAGKSILLDALSLAMGERADVSQIREGCLRAFICATFYIPDALQNTLHSWLEEFGFPIEAEGASVQLKRVIESSGRTKAFINGANATLAQLREIGNQLVDIHGQHEHQLLLKPGAQRDLLDRHAGLLDELSQVTSAYKTWQQLEKKVALAKATGSNLQKEKERLDWLLEDLNTLAPIENEWADIQLEHSRLANAATLIDGAQQLVNLLSEDENSLLNQLYKSQHLLEELVNLDNSLENAMEMLSPAGIQIDEAAHSINRYLQKLDLDPERLAELEERLQGYYRASKKLHCSPEELPKIWVGLQEQRDALEASQNIEALLKEAQTAKAKYLQAANALSKSRTKAATALSQEVTLSMQSLAMDGGQFVVELQSLEEGNQFGLENVEFLVAGHPGVKPRSVAKVASGGELARISLAIAVIASRASSVPTLIFDEVDAGIGGAVAQTVGQLLKRLGQSHQVLCVTHLPQVASQGDNQWRVKKISLNHKTISDIEVLGRNERVNEIARMLGGSAITETTLRHARELLDLRA